jgi:proteasome lid subunit RPN8/RPN11
MTYFIQAIIRALVAPDHRLNCSSSLWKRGLLELKFRGAGQRESGAFLLGFTDRDRRTITRFAFYDDLDKQCLDTGVVVFNGSAYGKLWDLCRTSGLMVVADVHTHPGLAGQSFIDQRNPMIAQKGHVAIIVPYFARRVFRANELGVYEYQGGHCWKEFNGKNATRYFYIGWGG